ncbi:MAG: 4Fe-4S binding protein [Erysipelotrichaceae bacterium]|nr:4Fe-4S binding protein [Erysipelotrichaceae bacterium]MDY5251281.1 4Fe-4S binding protein [Erysipelotrichaceae bacterium]
MQIKEIYDYFDKVGCCTFATIDGEYPETRIAHFLAYDDEGLYFMTMNTKPFYKQLKETGKVAVCGLSASPEVEELSDGNLHFEAGYFIRISGDVKEVSMEKIKAKNDPRFAYCIEDQQRYPAMTTFVVTRFKGEIFDYDFEKQQRDHKLERVRFSFNGFPLVKAGLTIGDKCIGCGQCAKVCSFDAISKTGSRYMIDENRCDECGNCYLNCPVHAISHKGK